MIMENDIPVEPVFNPNNKRVPIDVLKARLPIFRYKNEILYLLEKHQVLIIKGETGCGKSTQIPQYLVDAGWHIKKTTCNETVSKNLMICVSQPRRVSAIVLAKRVAEETNSTIGREVGYAVRSDICVTKNVTCLKYLTDGLLLREILSDPLLDKYSVIIVDDVHERNISTDLLIGLLKRILIRRDDLRIIICSATLDVERFVTFFTLNKSEYNHSKSITPGVLCVEGRSHPCEIFYSNYPVADYVKASVDTAIKIHEMNSMTSGDMLIFLTGQEEIEQAKSMLKEYSQSIRDRIDLKRLMVLPLYASLPHKEIMKVFETAGQNYRKCIVATNVAETTLTIDGIDFVIDCGFVKLRFFNPTTKSDDLVSVPISKAAADQRAGRAGRTRPGQIYRLYTEDSYEALYPFTTPEIQRCGLSNVILQLKTFGIRNIAGFELPTKMPAKNMRVALEHLYASGAIDPAGELARDTDIV